VKEYAESLKKYRLLAGEPRVVGTIDEKPLNFGLRHDLQKEDLEKIDIQGLSDFLTLFGSSLTCIVSEMVGKEAVSNLKLDPMALTQGEFQRFVGSFPAGTQFRLRVTIDKNQLLESVFGKVTGTILLYFDSKPILDTLDKDLLTIESLWFKPGEKVFLILGDRNVILEGDILHIFGEVSLNTIRPFVQAPLSSDKKEALEARLNARASETHWQNATQFMLPEHLKILDRTVGGDQVFKPKLNKHFLDLTIASLANYTRPAGAALVSLFEGQKRLEVGPNRTFAVSDAVCSDWFAIYDWAYEDHTRDKMSIVRNLVTLQPYTPIDQNYGVMTSSVNALVKSASDHYARFIGESIKTYFDKLKEATTYVQSRVDSVGQQVNGLVDNFTKNLLAIAGFVIGTVLAKLLDPNLARIYPLIAFAFVVYMGVILIVYYPLTFWSYVLTAKEYKHSLGLYKQSFTEDDVKKFIGDSFRRRKIHFWIAFLSTALVHVLLLGAAYFAHKRGWLS
jgi:hypothetical protein